MAHWLERSELLLGAENIEKLKNRYPGGEFQAWYSENRQPGDL